MLSARERIRIGQPTKSQGSNDEQNARRPFQPSRSAGAQQDRRANAREQNHSVEKSEQAPRRFVGEHGVDQHQAAGEKGHGSDQQEVGLTEPPAGESGDASNHRERNDQSLAPHRPVLMMKEKQAAEIEIPRMNVWRIAGGTMRPNPEGFQGIDQASEVGREGGEENHPN